MNYLLRLLPVLFLTFLYGCSTISPVNHVPKHDSNTPKKLVVFFDGTANDEASNTNIRKLYNLVTLQNRTDISASYIEGVGTKKKFIGAGLGWGIGYDVRQAYRYLGENYNQNNKDEVYIFGFSRGAYSARILAALTNIAGVVDLRSMTEKQKIKHVDEIYSLYKGSKSIQAGRDAISNFISHSVKPVRIKFMGLWETVEALGLPDLDENSDVPNIRYNDQLCNIDKASHALAVDDDRARIFTPILLTREHLIKQCEKAIDINRIVEEVWFSGAHSDVGGGYEDTNIDGVTLNWMLSQIDINAKELLPAGEGVYADPFGKTHDPEAGVWSLVYRKQNRDLNSMNSSYNHGKLKIHQSVIDRLACVPVNSHEFDWEKNYPHLFVQQGNTLLYKAGAINNSFEVVGGGYTRVACNHRLPFSQLKPCKLVGGSLDINEGCYADVIADRPSNETGVILKKGQIYTLNIKGGQSWKDASRINQPMCGESGSFMMNLLGEKRVNKSLWFSLIAEVKGESKPFDLCTGDKTSAQLRANASGELILYANDDKRYYLNNSGRIRVEVYRKK